MDSFWSRRAQESTLLDLEVPLSHVPFPRFSSLALPWAFLPPTQNLTVMCCKTWGDTYRTLQDAKQRDCLKIGIMLRKWVALKGQVTYTLSSPIFFPSAFNKINGTYQPVGWWVIKRNFKTLCSLWHMTQKFAFTTLIRMSERSQAQKAVLPYNSIYLKYKSSITNLWCLKAK